MKATIHGIQIEGTKEEVLDMIQALRQEEQPNKFKKDDVPEQLKAQTDAHSQQDALKYQQLIMYAHDKRFRQAQMWN